MVELARIDWSPLADQPEQVRPGFWRWLWQTDERVEDLERRCKKLGVERDLARLEADQLALVNVNLQRWVECLTARAVQAGAAAGIEPPQREKR